MFYPIAFAGNKATWKRPKAKSKSKPKQRTYKKRYFTGKEIKIHDHQLTTVLIHQTGAAVLLNSITRGDDYNQRNGRRLNMRSIHLKGIVTANSAGEDQFARVLLVQVLKPDMSAPSLTQIFNAATVTSMRKIDNISNYKVLMDKTLTINKPDEPGSQKLIKFYKKCFIPVEYNAAATGAVTDIDTNALFIMTVGTRPNDTTACTFSGTCRIHFSDN